MVEDASEALAGGGRFLAWASRAVHFPSTERRLPSHVDPSLRSVSASANFPVWINSRKSRNAANSAKSRSRKTPTQAAPRSILTPPWPPSARSAT